MFYLKIDPKVHDDASAHHVTKLPGSQVWVSNEWEWNGSDCSDCSPPDQTWVEPALSLQIYSLQCLSSLAPTCTAPGLQKKSVDLNVGDIIN